MTNDELLHKLDEIVSNGWVTDTQAQLVRDAIAEGAKIEYATGGHIGDAWFRVETPLSPALEARWRAVLEARPDDRPWYLWAVEYQADNPNYKIPCWFLNV